MHEVATVFDSVRRAAGELPVSPVQLAVAFVVLVVVALVVVQRRQARTTLGTTVGAPRTKTKKVRQGSAATRAWWLAALVGMSMSLDTSWSFVGERLHITNVIERAGMFAGAELLLIGCGLAARAAARKGDTPPAAARMVAWAICGVSGYMALSLSGLVIGPVRVLLGPVLAIVASHLALGIELRHARGKRSGTWDRIAGEMRERALSRLGLADDDRDALTRTRERAALRAARLVHEKGSAWRLSRALRIAGVAHDPKLRRLMLAELAVLKHASALGSVELRSPWDMSATDSDRALCDMVYGQARTASARIAERLAAMPWTPPAGPPILRGTSPADVPAPAVPARHVPGEASGNVPAEVPAEWLAELGTSGGSVAALRSRAGEVVARVGSERHVSDTDASADEVPESVGYGDKKAALRAAWDAARLRGETPDGPALRDAVRAGGVRVSARLARKYAAEWAGAELADDEAPAVAR